jgi:hypothetical protein
MSRVESGGGENGMLADDADDSVLAETSAGTAASATFDTARITSWARLDQNPVSAASEERAADACFATDELRSTHRARQAVGTSSANVLGALPDPLAAVAVVAIALGGYWRKPATEMATGRRRSQNLGIRCN